MSTYSRAVGYLAHLDELPRRRAGRQHLLAVGRVVHLARVAGAADDAPAAEDAEEPGEDAAVLVRRPCGSTGQSGGADVASMAWRSSAPYAAPYHPGGVPPASFNAIPPPGGAPGGRWTTEKYMGPFSWGIGLFTCCCLCFMCCPCDERQVYHEVSGRKLLQSGGPSGRFNEMC